MNTILRREAAALSREAGAPVRPNTGTGFVLPSLAMACPFFWPLRRIEGGVKLRLPLLGFFDGECRADGSASVLPDPVTLRDLCSFGYARGQCPRFPRDARTDAHRFSPPAHGAPTPEVLYVVEENGWPVQHGTLTPDSSGAILARQAQAWMENYSRLRNAHG